MKKTGLFFIALLLVMNSLAFIPANCETPTVTSNWLESQIVIDGQITSYDEWSDTTTLDIQMGIGEPVGPPYIQMRVLAKNDNEWVYFMCSVPWSSDEVDYDDGVEISYGWGPPDDLFQHYDSSFIGVDSYLWDAYMFNDEEQISDTQYTPAGELSIEGSAQYNGTHYVFEFRKQLSSNDGYDWHLEPGKLYGLMNGVPETGGVLAIELWDETLEDSYYSDIQLSLSKPTEARILVTDLKINSTEIQLGQSIEVSVKATNLGDFAGTQALTLYLDGKVFEETDIFLEVDEFKTVTFVFSLQKIGLYQISISGLEASVNVGNVEDSTLPSGDNNPDNSFWRNLELRDIVYMISISGTVIGFGGWLYRSRSEKRKKEILFSKLFSDVDEVYSQFKMNSVKCEAELINIREKIIDEFKRDMIDEKRYNLLTERIETYLREIREEIMRKEEL